ncbi:hypothetical protein AJ87_37465 [Rhizobium yanglingense]|nr:hypothetical protein AJ87_37465 [Rhizobium yanglingense]
MFLFDRRQLHEDLDGVVDSLVELDLSFRTIWLGARWIDHDEVAFQRDKVAADGLDARLAFRCPHREIGKTGAFIISVVSD